MSNGRGNKGSFPHRGVSEHPLGEGKKGGQNDPFLKTISMRKRANTNQTIRAGVLKNSAEKDLFIAYGVDIVCDRNKPPNMVREVQKQQKKGQKRGPDAKRLGSTTLRVPESSLTSVLTKPVVA